MRPHLRSLVRWYRNATVRCWPTVRIALASYWTAGIAWAAMTALHGRWLWRSAHAGDVLSAYGAGVVALGVLIAARPFLRAGLDAGTPMDGFDRTPRGGRRAGVLILLTEEPDPRVTLTERAGGLRRHAGQIAFPGGGMEPGDADIVAAALREANEEVGFPVESARVLGELPSAWVPARAVRQAWQVPSPPAGHCRAAAKARAATERPDPGGPVNSQACVIAVGSAIAACS